jgi:nitrite reductase/ring-hydroxylating ferredoxin subunit
MRVLVCKSDELRPGTMRAANVEGKEILVANVGGKPYAIGGSCNHAGGPLAEGTLEGAVVTCPWHGSKWDVTNGKLVEFAVELDPEPVYKVIVEGGSVYVEA